MDAHEKEENTIIAVTAAIQNIKNCVKRGDFNDQSVKNFKQNHKFEAILLEEIFGKIEDSTLWIEAISNFA